MAEVQEIPGERVVAEWSSIMLTSHRVVGRSPRGGTLSIPVQAVQWVGVQYVHYPWLLALALVALLGGFVADYLAVGAVALVVLVTAYFVTREQRLSVGAGSGTIAARVSGGSAQRDAALQFSRKVVAEVSVRLSTPASGGRVAA